MTEPYIAALGDRRPVIAPDAYLAPGSTVLGAARIGARSSLWYGAVVRADGDEITVGEDVNLQDGVVLHADPGFACTIGDRVSVGHRAVVHGATIADDVLIGMGAIVMNGARIGRWSLVAAGAVILAGTEIPEGSLVAGVPAKVRRETGEQERTMITLNHHAYAHHTGVHRTAVPVAR